MSVFYLRDPFSHFGDQAAEEAALLLLERLGFCVRVLDTMGTGAALISKGFVNSARRHARTLVAELQKLDPSGEVPLVVLEPSELSAIREDYRDLLTGASVAEKKRLGGVLSVEQLLLRSGAVETLYLPPRGQRVLFHPHCHERAAPQQAGRAIHAAMELLTSCGYDVEASGAGCCGMGGTFGYEAEHFELSRKIGELKLFPAVAGDGATLVAATGGSCRLHITQGTGREAVHPLVLAARAIGLV